MLGPLAEVGPARPASATAPSASPILKVAYARDRDPKLEGVSTLLESFEKTCEVHPNRPALGRRVMGPDGKPGPFEFITYQEMSNTVAALASALEQLGVKAQEKIGVYGPNAPEWMMTMQAMSRTNTVCVPLYDTLGDQAVEYIVKHSEARMVFCAGPKLGALAAVAPALKAQLGALGVAYWGAAPEAAVKAFEAAGVPLRTYGELVELGKRRPTFPTRPQPTDLCTIMYTSGTTGDPKGVMVNHRAVVSTIASLKDFLTQVGESVDHNDCFLSYLPLAHIFDRVAEEMMLAIGATIGYWQGDIRKIVEDIEALQPTVFVGVPRVFERIYTGVNEQVRKGGLLKNLVFSWAYWRKLWYMRAGWKQHQASPVSDMLVFDKIKKRLGGRVRVILSGGAPLAPHIEEFLKVAMCAPAVQGYGLTETCAGTAISDPWSMDQVGTVGPPLAHVQLRLESVPDMGYDACPAPGSQDPPRGEVCVRGPGVFSGYYKNEVATREVLDAEGFFHTGDVGEITPSGALRIIDRKKNIFKLSQGEYIAVEKLENAYKTSGVVEQIWVYGNSFESVLVAVVVPKKEALEAWAQGKGLPEGDFKALCGSEAARQYVLSELKAAGKAAKLKGFEDVKAVHLETSAFSVENDLMTPTFKLKRGPLQKSYQQQIDAMYARLKAEEAAKAR